MDKKPSFTEVVHIFYSSDIFIKLSEQFLWLKTCALKIFTAVFVTEIEN